MFGGSRPAAWALVVLGLIALGIAVIGDLPDLHDVGSFTARFEDASASGGPGVVFELLGAAGLIAAGAAWLWLGRDYQR